MYVDLCICILYLCRYMCRYYVHVGLVLYFAETLLIAKRRKIIALLLVLMCIILLLTTLYHPNTIPHNDDVRAVLLKNRYQESDIKNTIPHNDDVPAILLKNRYQESDINNENPVKTLTDIQNFDFSNPHVSRPTYIEDILIAIKTSKKFHRNRLQVLLDTWISQALHSVSLHHPGYYINIYVRTYIHDDIIFRVQYHIYKKNICGIIDICAY